MAAGRPNDDAMETSLAKYIWQHTRPQQIWILSIVLLSMPTYFLALDLPKRIVNGPIQGEGFDMPDATQLYMSLGLPNFLGGGTLFEGFDLGRYGALAYLSGMFLLLVCVNGLFKYYINTYKGRLGERMLRRMRYELVDRVLRFPFAQFRKVKPSEVSTMIKDEVEPLGGFIGDAFVLPVFLGGQALTAMIFILVQSLSLGMIAFSIVMVQAFIIPKLRRQLIRLAKERQLTARELSGRVGEIVEGVSAIRTNDTSNYERADISARLGRIFAIRYEFYQRKFFIKFLNNFLAQITPFLFYAIGGYYAIRGELDIGQLVAVIAAYKDLPAPVKDLINWDQQRVDVQVKYTQVTEQFSVENMIRPETQAPLLDAVPHLTGEIQVSNISVIDESGAKLIESASVDIPLNARIAVIGTVNSGAENFLEVLARLTPPTTGSVTIGGVNLANAPEPLTGRRIGFASPEAYLPQASLRDSVLYPLRNRPLTDAAPDPDLSAKLAERFKLETKLSGNIELDFRSDWTDYETAGVSGAEELNERLLALLEHVELQQDIYDLGLRGVIDPDTLPGLKEKILEGRTMLRSRLAEASLSDYVEPFDPAAYNNQATIATNLFFGRRIGSVFGDDDPASHPYMQKVLADTGLDEKLFRMGVDIARTINELFADVSPDDPLFEQFNFYDHEEIPAYQSAVLRFGDKPLKEAPADTKRMLLSLPFKYAEPRHRFGLLDDELKAQIVAARAVLRDGLPEALHSEIEFYDPDEYASSASIEDNIIFGRIAMGVAEAPAKIRAMLLKVLDDLGLNDTIRQAGLLYDVGTGGKRLTATQRQKIGLARALVKRPDLLIVNRALSGLDPKTQQTIIERSLSEARAKGFGVIWAPAQAKLAELFDLVVVFDAGHIVETGSPKELSAAGTVYQQLVG
jgi:putative ABC transport system ATP-binding protein